MSADQGHFDRLRIKLRGAEAAVKKARVSCKNAQGALDAAKTAGGDVEAAEARLSSAQAALTEAQAAAAAAAEKAVKKEQERLERAGIKVAVEARAKPSPVARGPTPSKSPVARPRPGPPPAALMRKPSAAAPAPARPPKAPKAPKPAAAPKATAPKPVAAAPAAGLPPPAPTTVSAPAEPVAPAFVPAVRKFPMEDSEIDEFDPGRPALHGCPCWLSSEDDSARLAAALYVCEAAGHFRATFGLIQPPRLAALQRALAVNASPAAAAPLGELYSRLLSFLLENARDDGTAKERDLRLLSVLTAATWPEVLRQWLGDRAAAAAAAAAEAAADKGDKGEKDDALSLPPGEHLEAALAGLAADGADGIGPDTHLALLHWLLDEATATARMWTAMQEMEDTAAKEQRKLKGTMAEERRKIKELMEASREAKKQRLAPMAGVAALPPPLTLPEELREYRGDPGDAAARAAFDKRREKEGKRLEQERGRWEAAHEKARVAALERSRESLKAEQSRHTDIQIAKDVIRRAQEELEASQEGLAPRCAPLGVDRLHRRYWAFPHADHAALYVEDEATGLWGVFLQPEDLRRLAETLDHRDEREAALAKALEKRRPALAKAMLEKKDEKVPEIVMVDLVSNDGSGDTEVQEEAEMEEIGEEAEGGRGKRKRRLPPQFGEKEEEEEEEEDHSEIDDRAKRRRAKEKERRAQEEATRAAIPMPCFKLDCAAAAAAAAPLLGPCEALAFAGTLERLLEVRQLASDAEVPGPSAADANWAAWTANARAAARGHVRLPSGDGFVPALSAASLCAVLQARAVELEAAVVNATREIRDLPRRSGGGFVVVGVSGSDAEDGGQTEGEEEKEEEGREGREGAAADPSTALFEFEVFRGAERAAEALKGISFDRFFPSNVTGKALWRHRRDRLAWQVAAAQQGAPAAQVAFWVEVLARQVTALLGGAQKIEPAVKPQPKAARGGQRRRMDRRRKKAEKEAEEDAVADMEVEVVDLVSEEHEEVEEEEEKKPQRGVGRKRRQGGPAPGATARRTTRARKK